MARQTVAVTPDELNSAIRWENIRHAYFSQHIHTQDKARESQLKAEGYFRKLKATFGT